MELTAHDIHEKQFNDAWRGYNQEEVDDFLDRVAEAVEVLRRENESLHERIRDLDQAVAASRDTEEMLKKTLVTAQRAAEEAIARAKAKADELIAVAEDRARATEERARAAEEEARRRVASAEEEARLKSSQEEERLLLRRRELDERIETLKSFEAETKARLRTFFHQQLNALDALSDGEPQPAVTEPAPAAAPVASEPSPEPQPSPEPEREREETSRMRDLFFRHQG